MGENKNICVFLSAGDIAPKYEYPALKLVGLIARNDWSFVYGGSEKGLMKKAADVTRKSGGRIVSVACEEFKKEWRADVDQLIQCPNISDRKKKILEISDAVVAVPGGTGTLDEFTEVIETRKWGGHNKPLVLLNSAGFWNGLLQQLDLMTTERFLTRSPSELFYTASVPEEAIAYLKDVLTRK